MRCWLFFNRDLGPDVPEAHEVMRFVEAAKTLDIELHVLKPSEFDLVVDSLGGWSAIYQGRELRKPDLIIPRTGSETSYFTLAVLRHFERQGVAIVNPPAAIEAVADKLHTLQVLAGAGLPIPKTILGQVSGRCRLGGAGDRVSGGGEEAARHARRRRHAVREPRAV